MKAFLVLSEQKSVYRPGDKVSGVVKVNIASSAEIEKITVSLRGLSTTHVIFVKYWGAQSNFKKSATLFSRLTEVFTGPYTLNAGDHQWPFEFTIPQQCERHESQAFQDKKSPIFDDDEDQDIPPALDEVLSRGFQTSGNWYSITYPLTLTVVSDKLLGASEQEYTQNLNIQPWREIEHPPWRSMTSICKFQTIIGPTVAHTGKRMSSLFKRRGSVQGEPNFSFQVNAKIATVVVVGKPIPMFISLQHDAPPSGIAVPEFKIKAISAMLLTNHIIRSQGSSQELYLSGAPESYWPETTTIGSKLSMKIPILDGDMLDVRTMVNDFHIPATTTPSFASFSVCRMHEMNVKVEIECNGESFTASFTTKRTIILPEFYGPPVSTSEKKDPGTTESKGPDDPDTDRRHDSFGDAATPGDAPPSFYNATGQRGDELPGYSRDGAY